MGVGGRCLVRHLFQILDSYPRRVYALMALTCIGLLAFGLYLQHEIGLEPCPMCIVQRYLFVLVALLALAAASWPARRAGLVLGGVIVVLAGAGAFVAARQSWLQWYPPEVASCGRDLYGMIENFPLQRAIPMIFRGSGDCAAVDWTFLGGSLANWSFVVFCAITLLCSTLLWRRVRARA